MAIGNYEIVSESAKKSHEITDVPGHLLNPWDGPQWFKELFLQLGNMHVIAIWKQSHFVKFTNFIMSNLYILVCLIQGSITHQTQRQPVTTSECTVCVHVSRCQDRQGHIRIIEFQVWLEKKQERWQQSSGSNLRLPHLEWWEKTNKKRMEMNERQTYCLCKSICDLAVLCFQLPCQQFPKTSLSTKAL